MNKSNLETIKLIKNGLNYIIDTYSKLVDVGLLGLHDDSGVDLEAGKVGLVQLGDAGQQTPLPQALVSISNFFGMILYVQEVVIHFTFSFCVDAALAMTAVHLHARIQNFSFQLFG